ncbi:hypothetical protein XELAEV_18025776mg [Xenopus laevis]|uniref:Uncharacterized protein n=1 Tax=Xenopus laevis TaxID=8355 RepID=A0A974HM82_XENLA|nr:hypothetical protein XELAEV_18025776mg [Xenopus laevis]
MQVVMLLMPLTKGGWPCHIRAERERKVAQSCVSVSGRMKLSLPILFICAKIITGTAQNKAEDGNVPPVWYMILCESKASSAACAMYAHED